MKQSDLNVKLCVLLPAFLVLLLLSSCGSGSKQKGLVYFNDFESSKGWVPGLNLTKYPVHSGIYSYKMDTAHTYGPTLRLKFEDISPLPIRKLKYSMWCYLKNPNAKGKIVVAVDAGEQKNILWEAKHIQDLTSKYGQWVEIKGECNLTKENVNAPQNLINFYPWNLSKEDICIDDMRVEFVL
jgi:hypothetical protein